MISTSPAVKILSFLSASVILVGGMQLASSDVSTEIEGAGMAREAKMGSSFEDMAVGTLTPEPAVDTTEVQPPQEVVESVTTAQETPQEPVLTTTPAEPAQTTMPAEPPVQTAKRAPLVTAPPPPSPDALMAVSPTAVAITPTPVMPVSATAPAEPTHTMAALEPKTTAPPQSMRPRRKDPEQAAKVAQSRPKPKVTRAKVTPKATKSPRGNAKRDNTKGARNGTSTAKAKSQGTSNRANAKSGNAAVSNYPGQVMRRISRVRKPRVNSRGTATVAFAIASGGGLSRVSISRSSGSAALDKAALRVIQKAAPFPAPPRGAKRQYFIRIKGS